MRAIRTGIIIGLAVTALAALVFAQSESTLSVQPQGLTKLQVEGTKNGNGEDVIQETFSAVSGLRWGVAQKRNTLGVMPNTPVGSPAPFPTPTRKAVLPAAGPTPADVCIVCADPLNVKPISVWTQFGDALTLVAGACSPPYPARNTLAASVPVGSTWPNTGWPRSCDYLTWTGTWEGDACVLISF